jgi:hypothetical protein
MEHRKRDSEIATRSSQIPTRSSEMSTGNFEIETAASEIATVGSEIATVGSEIVTPGFAGAPTLHLLGVELTLILKELHNESPHDETPVQIFSGAHSDWIALPDAVCRRDLQRGTVAL